MNNIIITIKNLIYQGKARVYEKTLTKSCYRIRDNIKSRNWIEPLNWPKKYCEFNNTYNIFNNTLLVNVKTFLGSKKPLFYDFKLIN